MNRPLPRIRRSSIVLVALTVLLAFPLGVLASHTFGDVPNSNPFHNDIDAIAEAGVTTGCGGGNYCPKANVTREQMAAFMNRLGALGPGTDPVVNAKTSESTDGWSVGCPTGTVWSQGLCFQTATRGPGNVFEASDDCASLQGFLGAGWRYRLPTALELRGARTLSQVTIDPGGEVTDSLHDDDGVISYIRVLESGGVSAVANGTNLKYRCVTPPLGRDSILLLSPADQALYPEALPAPAGAVGPDGAAVE